VGVLKSLGAFLSDRSSIRKKLELNRESHSIGIGNDEASRETVIAMASLHLFEIDGLGNAQTKVSAH
jgi:hypothetical protein